MTDHAPITVTGCSLYILLVVLHTDEPDISSHADVERLIRDGEAHKARDRKIRARVKKPLAVPGRTDRETGRKETGRTPSKAGRTEAATRQTPSKAGRTETATRQTPSKAEQASGQKRESNTPEELVRYSMPLSSDLIILLKFYGI